MFGCGLLVLCLSWAGGGCWFLGLWVLGLRVLVGLGCFCFVLNLLVVVVLGFGVCGWFGVLFLWSCFVCLGF